MSPHAHPNLTVDLLKANPVVMSMMAFSMAVAFCLDFADAVAAKDALRAFPVKKD